MSQQTLPLIWLVAIFAIFYFMILRPQQQRTKQQRQQQSSLAVGDKVVTIGGAHGTVKSLTDDTMTLQVAENTKIVFSRGALASIVESKAKKSEMEAKAGEEAKGGEEAASIEAPKDEPQ